MIVDPPCTTSRALTSSNTARAMPCGSIPPWVVEAPVLDRDRRLRHPRADAREGDDLPVPLGRDRAEQRAVGGVDEGVLADPHLVQSREIAGRAERVDPAAARNGRSGHDSGHDQEHDEQRPATLLAASAANGDVVFQPTLGSAAGRAHGAMVAIVLARFGVGCPAPLTLSARVRARVGVWRTTRAARRLHSASSS